MQSAGARFGYYKSLSAAEKRIYDHSDRITKVRLPGPERFAPYVAALQKALAADDKARTQEVAQKFITGLTNVFKVPPLRVKVLAVRPSRRWGELHGLYEAEEGRRSMITVWMRTAKRKDVVAFRTFLRTLLHEPMHHLDYTLLGLEDSFHTEGFFKREAALARLLLGNSGKGKERRS